MADNKSEFKSIVVCLFLLSFLLGAISVEFPWTKYVICASFILLYFGLFIFWLFFERPRKNISKSLSETENKQQEQERN